MYALLTRLSQDAMSEEAFAQRYRDVAATMSLSGLDYAILSTLTNPTNVRRWPDQAPCTRLVGVG